MAKRTKPQAEAADVIPLQPPPGGAVVRMYRIGQRLLSRRIRRQEGRQARVRAHRLRLQARLAGQAR